MEDTLRNVTKGMLKSEVAKTFGLVKAFLVNFDAEYQFPHKFFY